jgi:hypothetical protein
MKNRNFTKKYTNRKTINSNNSAKLEVNWPRGSNVKPGVKWKQENVATKVDKRKYEDKRDHCFQEYWLENIPWLQHDERGMSTGARYKNIIGKETNFLRKFFTSPADRQRINFCRT